MGNTHLAISLGLKAFPARRSVLFSSAAALLDELAAAEVSHNLGKVLAHLRRVDLLIVDELGYFPMYGRRAGRRNETGTVRPSPCSYRRALAGVQAPAPASANEPRSRVRVSRKGMLPPCARVELWWTIRCTNSK